MHDCDSFECGGIERERLFERGSSGMSVVSMALIYTGEILHGASAAVARIYSSGIGRIASDPIGGLQYRSCQSGCHRHFASNETSAYSENAAGAGGVVTR